MTGPGTGAWTDVWGRALGSGASNRRQVLVVPDRRLRIIPEVVSAGRLSVGVLGIWRGEGLSKGWNRGGQFTSNLRPRWTDPVTARRVPSK
jgi:hypothetical protein